MSSSDLSTFNGRFLHFLKVTDPRTLLYSKQDVLDAKCAVDVFKDKGIACGEPSDMPHYQRLVNSAIHPVTNEIIPRLFRVSAIAPVNIPLVFAMLSCPASNIPGTLFLHWLNQSYNTACNYYNRSGAEQSLEQTVKAYTLAVSSACSFAYGLGKLVDHYPTTLKRFGVIIPCVATAVASCSNLCFTRYDEMENGVLMIDQEQKEHGHSRIAGLQVVMQTAVSRCVLVPCACLLLPPVAMTILRASRLLPNSRTAIMAIELSIIYISLQAAMPAALAIFPQSAKFNANELEEQFKSIVDISGHPVKWLYTNKGL